MTFLNLSLVEILSIAGNIFVPLIAGLVIWLLGEKAIDKRIKNEAIRELMTFRGAFSSPEFRRALNKISVTFHNDAAVRKEVRKLYEAMNNPDIQETNINRKIVGLIYNLCQKNGFKGITEYDIDQAFSEFIQTPPQSIDSLTEKRKVEQPRRATKIKKK